MYWDNWQSLAIQNGIHPEIARAGRDLMRDHYQHGLGDLHLGAESDFSKMLDLALTAPVTAYYRFVEDIAAVNGDSQPEQFAENATCDLFSLPDRESLANALEQGR